MNYSCMLSNWFTAQFGNRTQKQTKPIDKFSIFCNSSGGSRTSVNKTHKPPPKVFWGKKHLKLHFWAHVHFEIASIQKSLITKWSENMVPISNTKVKKQFWDFCTPWIFIHASLHRPITNILILSSYDTEYY